MNIKPTAGEVWFADLGIAAKSRPVLVLAVPGDHDARALVVVVPLTSQIRGLSGEIELGPLRWLPKLSAVNIQGLASFDRHKLARKLGTLAPGKMDEVKEALRVLLQL